MTATKQSIKSDLRKFKGHRKSKIIVYFEGEPEPPHKKGDIVIQFGENERKCL